MSLSFNCHQCGAQRVLNDDGTAPDCPDCGAGLPGQEGDAPIGDQPGQLTPLAQEEPQAAFDVDHAAHESSDAEAGYDEPAASDDGHDDDEPPPESMSFTPKEREEGDMDMTPMVDVTFLLLIFFMITAAFSLQKSIEIPKPEETDQASTQVQEEIEDNTDYITIIIDQFNTFRVQTADSEEEAPGKHDLLRKLRRARDEAPPDQIPNKLLVKAHGDATHGRVVMALDAGAEVGMEQVQLMTVEEDL